MIIGKNNQDINACCFLFARITSLNNWKVETIYACQKCNSILMDDKCGKMQSTFSKSINSHYMFFRSKCHFYHLYLTCRATLQPFMFNCSIILRFSMYCIVFYRSLILFYFLYFSHWRAEQQQCVHSLEVTPCTQPGLVTHNQFLSEMATLLRWSSLINQIDR